jgi:hypothetical protein
MSTNKINPHTPQPPKNPRTEISLALTEYQSKKNEGSLTKLFSLFKTVIAKVISDAVFELTMTNKLSSDDITDITQQANVLFLTTITKLDPSQPDNVLIQIVKKTLTLRLSSFAKKIAQEA